MTEQSETTDLHQFLFVDTNVFLHFQFFRDVDWCGECGAKAVTLVLAPVILDELDDKKREGSRRDKSRAQAVLRAIGGLDLAKGPAVLRPGVSVEALDDEPDDNCFAQHRLRPRNGDDRLIASALSFQAVNPEAQVSILSDDTGLGIRGPRRNVKVRAPAEHLRLPDEPDDTERALQEMRRENQVLKSAAPKLRLRFVDGAHLELETAIVGPWQPEQRRQAQAQWRERYPHVSGAAGRITLPGGQTLDFGGIHQAFAQRSAADAAERNEEIDEAFGRLDAYLESWPELINSFRRCIEVRLVLENDGNAFANDVHLTLTTSAPGAWRDELPEINRPPAPPRERDSFDFARPYIRDLDIPTLAHRDAPIDGPNIDDDAAETEFTVRRVKHSVPCELPMVYFQFSTDADVASFTIDYKLVAANLPEPQEGTLNVRIALGPLQSPPPPDKAFEIFGDDD